MKSKKIFPALLANEAIKGLCGRDVLRGRASHAYIIDGPDGSGKHTAARQIAMAILCENKSRDELPCPCGACASCRKAASGFSTSIEYVSRGSAATLQVDVIRKMLSTVSYLPEDGDYKIYVCSLCGSFIPCNMNSTFNFSNYCPNCGASMEVEHEKV